MMKRIVAGAAAAGLALSLMGAGSAQAGPCAAAQNAKSNPQAVTVPGRGTTTLYRSPATPGPGTTGGYIGVSGDAGWIEVGGDTTNGGGVQGKATGQPVDGHLVISQDAAKRDVCVAEKDLA